jgi:uncharacterized protein YbjT (DUF2867 family)
VVSPWRLLRIAWAAPCSLIGLCGGAVALLLGGRVRAAAGALEFSLPADRRLGAALAARLPFGAITFGHVVVGVDPEQLELLRAHERVHVRQYEVLGPLFLLAYPLASIVAAARGRPAYLGNWFEVQARRVVAAEGMAVPLTHGD